MIMRGSRRQRKCTWQVDDFGRRLIVLVVMWRFADAGATRYAAALMQIQTGVGGSAAVPVKPGEPVQLQGG